MTDRKKHDAMANAIRALSMDAVEKANSGHPGLPMGCADIATVPPAVLKGLVRHPLTDKGIDGFLADWKKAGQRIE